MAHVPLRLLLEKCKKNSKKNAKKKRIPQSLANFEDKTSSSSGFLRPHFQDIFPIFFPHSIVMNLKTETAMRLKNSNYIET